MGKNRGLQAATTAATVQADSTATVQADSTATVQADSTATVQAATATVQAATVQAALLVLGAKAPRHRAGHNAAAWAAMLPLLPATAATLAALPAVKVCGGSKGNGLLMVGYCVRRGWLAAQGQE